MNEKGYQARPGFTLWTLKIILILNTIYTFSSKSFKHFTGT